MKHLPGARKGKRRGSKGSVRGGATARGAIGKGGCISVIEGRKSEEMTRLKTSSLRGWKYLLSPNGDDGN